MDCIPILFNPNSKRKKKKIPLPRAASGAPPAPAPGPKPTLQPGPPGARRPEPAAALRNRAPVPRGHLHPAVGRLLCAWPLAQAGLGSVCPRSGHRQLHLRLPLHAPGGSAGPELRRLLLRLAAFRHPPAPPSPPGAGRPATGHLPLGLGADSRDRRARAGPAPRVRVCVRVGPEPGFGFGFTTAPTQVMAPASASAPAPASAPASRRPLARSLTRTRVRRSLGPLVLQSRAPSPLASRAGKGTAWAPSLGRAVYLGGGGARGRSELTGRDPPSRHCGSAGKAGREKGEKEGGTWMCGTRAARARGGCSEGAWLRPSAISVASARAARGRPGRTRKSSGSSGMLWEAWREKGPPLLRRWPGGGA